MDNEDKIVLGITLGLVILIPSIAFLFVETYIPAEIVIRMRRNTPCFSYGDISRSPFV